MELEARVKRLQRAVGVARDIFAGCVFVAGGVGVLYGAYFMANIRSENIRETIALEGSGQKVEYLARTPRNGFLSRMPWNDDNGHAIMKVSGVTAVDEDYNGSLLGSVDHLSIIVGEKKEKCYAEKAVDIEGKDIPFVESKDPIRNRMMVAAREYCSSQRAMANGIYQQARKQLKAD